MSKGDKIAQILLVIVILVLLPIAFLSKKPSDAAVFGIIIGALYTLVMFWRRLL